MGKPIARLGDTSDHGGQIVSAAAHHSTEGKPTARVTDRFQCPIHGLTTILTGSPSWSIEGQNVARSGSVCGCGAVIIGGATKTVCG